MKDLITLVWKKLRWPEKPSAALTVVITALAIWCRGLRGRDRDTAVVARVDHCLSVVVTAPFAVTPAILAVVCQIYQHLFTLCVWFAIKKDVRPPYGPGDGFPLVAVS